MISVFLCNYQVMTFTSDYDITMLEELEECASSTAEDAAPRRCGGAARTGLVLAAGLAVAGTALFATAGPAFHRAGRPSALHRASLALSRANLGATTKLDASFDELDPCRDFPHLKMQRLVRNNLGRKGPRPSPQEGMVFEGVNIDPDLLPQEGQRERVDLHVNALSEFDPAWVNPSDLGFSGGGHHFMRVNLKAGRNVTLKLATMRPGTTEPMTLRRATFTFFDLDSHGSGRNQEYVQAAGSKATITYDGTELVESFTEQEDGETTLRSKMFKATQPGDGDDNPTDPLELTEQQLQRAVTFVYEPFTEAVVTLGSTEGHFNGRKFDFVGRPSLQCARGVEPDRVVIVDTPVEDEEVPTCCVVKYHFIKIACVPTEEKSFYHFMC